MNLLTPLQRTALERIEQIAARHRDHNQRLSADERADMAWIVRYADYLRRSLTLVISNETRDAFERRQL